jgi:fructose/tagatose bisphosphate aldolase
MAISSSCANSSITPPKPGYSVPALNIARLEPIQAIVQCALETGSRVILCTR